MSEQNQKVKKQTQAEQIGKFNNSEVEKNQQQHVALEKTKQKTNTNQTETFLADSQIAIKKSSPLVNSKQKEASRNDDYLKDIERAKKTILATKEFANYSYFKQIKDQIQLHWESAIKAKIIDLLRGERNIASKQAEHRTRLLIVINKDGLLLGVKRLNNTIEEDLDESAIEAFRAASPFPPPPENLIGRDGTVKIRWDFVVER